MTGSRASILASIQQSLKTARHLPEAPKVVLAPPLPAPDMDTLAATFAAELERLSGTVMTLPPWEVAPWLAGLLKERGATDLLAWKADSLPVPGLLAALRESGVNILDGEVPAA